MLLQVALIGNMLLPATNAPVPPATQADAAASRAEADHHPAKVDGPQDIVQVATVDSFQVKSLMFPARDLRLRGKPRKSVKVR